MRVGCPARHLAVDKDRRRGQAAKSPQPRDHGGFSEPRRAKQRSDAARLQARRSRQAVKAVRQGSGEAYAACQSF